MSRLRDLVAAGVVCTWSGVQRRPLRPLDRWTVQGSGAGAVMPSGPDDVDMGVGVRVWRPGPVGAVQRGRHGESV